MNATVAAILTFWKLFGVFFNNFIWFKVVPPVVIILHTAERRRRPGTAKKRTEANVKAKRKRKSHYKVYKKRRRNKTKILPLNRDSAPEAPVSKLGFEGSSRWHTHANLGTEPIAPHSAVVSFGSENMATVFECTDARWRVGLDGWASKMAEFFWRSGRALTPFSRFGFREKNQKKNMGRGVFIGCDKIRAHKNCHPRSDVFFFILTRMFVGAPNSIIFSLESRCPLGEISVNML